jgi:hypothetical protein
LVQSAKLNGHEPWAYRLKGFRRIFSRFDKLDRMCSPASSASR